jgi:histone H3/H4
MNETFRKCSTCRVAIEFGAGYFRCSVSTCNRKRTALYFCSVSCWDAHQAEARHRDAWAESETAPSRAEHEAALRDERATGASAPAAPLEPKGAKGRAAREVLVVVSKLKDYAKRRAGVAVSDRVTGVLSDHLRELCDSAAILAARDARKTLLDRDVRPLVSRRSLALGITDDDDEPGVTLVVVSKLKEYVRASASMNTSDGVVPVLSGHLRHLAREAIREAGADDRKTILDRDFVVVLGRRG